MKNLILIVLITTGQFAFAWSGSGVKGDTYEFKSEEGKMSIVFPAEFKIEEEPAEGSHNIKATAELGDKGYFMAVTIHETPLMDHYGLSKISLESFTNSVEGNLISSEDYEYKEHKGKDAVISFGDNGGKVFYRILLIGQYQYQIIILSYSGEDLNKKDKKFFKSFQYNE